MPFLWLMPPDAIERRLASNSRAPGHFISPLKPDDAADCFIDLSLSMPFRFFRHATPPDTLTPPPQVYFIFAMPPLRHCH